MEKNSCPLFWGHWFLSGEVLGPNPRTQMTLTLGSLSFLVPGRKNKPVLHPRPKLPDEIFTQWWQKAVSPFLASYLLVFPMPLPFVRQGTHGGSQFH